MDGARVRADSRTVLKRGDLDLDAPAFKSSVPLAGVKTIGQMLGRASAACATWNFTPTRAMEDKSLTMLRKRDAAPAADLLRAVALCVTGAYRKVGAAYVLTDDIVGIGTRRQLWADFEQRASVMRQGDAGRRRATPSRQATLWTTFPRRASRWALPRRRWRRSTSSTPGDLADHMMPERRHPRA